MAQRTVCLCDGKYIGIETIYTVVDGRQINIPERLKELRAKSRSNQLFCPCGCGSNLILVAGDRNLREQHFRLKDGEFNQNCHAVTEGSCSIDSKIVLKCWLDDKLDEGEVESRVLIHAVDDSSRKYEFSLLSRKQGIAVSYCRDRVNLSDEKFDILESNSKGIKIIYVVDAGNRGTNGQYPEGLMKIQNRRGRIAREAEFVSYGGLGRVNLGICSDCSRNNPAVKEREEQKQKQSGEKKRYDPYVCPECGGRLVEKSGRFGRFLGCCNYPRCRYTRKAGN